MISLPGIIDSSILFAQAHQTDINVPINKYSKLNNFIDNIISI